MFNVGLYYLVLYVDALEGLRGGLSCYLVTAPQQRLHPSLSLRSHPVADIFDIISLHFLLKVQVRQT